MIRCDSHQIYRSRYDQLLLHLLVLQDKNTSIILEKEDRCSGMYVTAFRMYQILVPLPSLLTVRCNFRRFWRALIVRFCLLFRPSRLVATSQSRRRDFAQGLPEATRPDLALSVRRHLFAEEREGLLVFEFGCITLKLLGLLGFQPCLLVESRPSAYQPFVLLDIPSHRVDAPLISLDFEQLLQFR